MDGIHWQARACGKLGSQRYERVHGHCLHAPLLSSLAEAMVMTMSKGGQITAVKQKQDGRAKSFGKEMRAKGRCWKVIGRRVEKRI